MDGTAPHGAKRILMVVGWAIVALIVAAVLLYAIAFVMLAPVMT